MEAPLSLNAVPAGADALCARARDWVSGLDRGRGSEVGLVTRGPSLLCLRPEYGSYRVVRSALQDAWVPWIGTLFRLRLPLRETVGTFDFWCGIGAPRRVVRRYALAPGSGRPAQAARVGACVAPVDRQQRDALLQARGEGPRVRPQRGGALDRALAPWCGERALRPSLLALSECRAPGLGLPAPEANRLAGLARVEAQGRVAARAAGLEPGACVVAPLAALAVLFDRAARGAGGPARFAGPAAAPPGPEGAFLARVVVVGTLPGAVFRAVFAARARDRVFCAAQLRRSQRERSR